jgi:radical SAM superfamily enzyme YgiQ (UPF0313 family)
MNILLVWPPSAEYCILNEKYSCCEPLSLEYIAAPLLKDFSVKIADMRFEKDIEEILKQTRYDIVGVSVPFTASVNVCNKIMEKVKSFDSSIKVIAGGHYPTVTFEHLHTEYFDFAVIGEGVHTFYELAKAIKDGSDYTKINGIAYKKGNEFVHTEKRKFETLDDYPLPARHLVSENRDKYFHAHYKPVTMMRFSAGCPFNCSFCILWKLTGRKYITRNNQSILDELKGIQGENIYVVDDEAFIDTRKMHELAQMILDANIKKKFHMYVRSDSVVNNPELFEIWAKAGLDSVLIGLESIFEDDLKGYHKNISGQMARKCVEILHKNNVEIRANFIVKPEYSREDFKKLKEKVFELNIDRPTFAVLTPFHGTEEYERTKDKFITNKLEFFDCYHTFLPTKLPLKEFYKEFADLFRAANSRDAGGGNNKIFYSGSGSDFDEMTRMMEESYLYY